MLEGGQTPLLTNQVLEDMGYRIALWPNSLVRYFAFAGATLLRQLRTQGTTEALLNQMVDFPELNDMLGMREFASLEARFVPEISAQRDL